MPIKLPVLLLIAGAIGLFSCKNNDNVFKPVVYSSINIVNASADTLNFYVNGTRLNNNASLSPSSQSFYLPVPAGQQNYQLKKAGNPVALFNLPLTLVKGFNYSLYVAGETAARSFSSQDILDTSGTTGVNFIRLRFVNASPDAGDLSVSIGDTASFSALSFAKISALRLVGSGQKVIKVYQSGAVVPIVDTTLLMSPGHVFTLYSKGLLQGKGTAKFGVGLARNY